MTYHSVRGGGRQAVWLAEADDGNGKTVTAIFIGQNARQRADEYAAWKNGDLKRESRSVKREHPKVA